jgi:hypothetical protein
MPVEGHWERLATPLSRREKRLLIALGVLVAAVVAAISIYAVTDTSGPQAGCVSATFAASLGGTTVHACGADAQKLCRTRAPENEPIAAACRQAGIGYPGR